MSHPRHYLKVASFKTLSNTRTGKECRNHSRTNWIVWKKERSRVWEFLSIFPIYSNQVVWKGTPGHLQWSEISPPDPMWFFFFFFFIWQIYIEYLLHVRASVSYWGRSRTNRFPALKMPIQFPFIKGEGQKKNIRKHKQNPSKHTCE